MHKTTALFLALAAATSCKPETVTLGLTKDDTPSVPITNQGAAQDTELNMPLHFSACCGHTAVGRLLIANNADINARDNDGMPLHCAAQNGHTAVGRLLIANNADINARDNDGTPPHYTAREEDEIVEALIRKYGGVE